MPGIRTVSAAPDTSRTPHATLAPAVGLRHKSHIPPTERGAEQRVTPTSVAGSITLPMRPRTAAWSSPPTTARRFVTRRFVTNRVGLSPRPPGRGCFALSPSARSFFSADNRCPILGLVTLPRAYRPPGECRPFRRIALAHVLHVADQVCLGRVAGPRAPACLVSAGPSDQFIACSCCSVIPLARVTYRPAGSPASSAARACVLASS